MMRGDDAHRRQSVRTECGRANFPSIDTPAQPVTDRFLQYANAARSPLNSP